MARAFAVAVAMTCACVERSPSPYIAPTDPGAAAAPSSTVAAAPPGSPGCGNAARGGALVGQHVQAGGRDRTYTLVIPDGYSPTTFYPVVFVLHGGGGSAAAARTQTDLERVAAGRAIFVYPQAAGAEWDLDSPAPSNGDVALFDLLLFQIHNAYCVEPRRVFVTGFSNGAYMANQLACRRGDRIRGVVTHAGGGPYDLHGSYDADGHLVCAGKAVASLVVHGASDGTVAPTEGQKSLDHWSFANRCAGGTTSAWLSPCVALAGCYQPVGVCRIPGLGHATWREAGRVTWSFIDSLR
jgi:polyhydroxybutyrate depolymerase